MRYRSLLILASLFLLAIVMAGIPGCHGLSAAQHAGAAISATGSDLDQAGAYVKAAESGARSAVAHADAAGKALLGLVSTEHASALDLLELAKADLKKVNDAVGMMSKTITTQKATIEQLTNSWGHKFQVFVDGLLTLLLILAGVHLLAGALSILLPPPYAFWCKLVANFVNPLGWTSWAISEFARVEEAMMKPNGTAAAPIHAIIEPPKTA